MDIISRGFRCISCFFLNPELSCLTSCSNIKICKAGSRRAHLRAQMRYLLSIIPNPVDIVLFPILNVMLPFNPAVIPSPFHPRACCAFPGLFLKFPSPLQKISPAFFILCFQRTYISFLRPSSLLSFPPILSLTPCCHDSS